MNLKSTFEGGLRMLRKIYLNTHKSSPCSWYTCNSIASNRLISLPLTDWWGGEYNHTATPSPYVIR